MTPPREIAFVHCVVDGKSSVLKFASGGTANGIFVALGLEEWRGTELFGLRNDRCDVLRGSSQIPAGNYDLVGLWESKKTAKLKQD